MRGSLRWTGACVFVACVLGGCSGSTAEQAATQQPVANTPKATSTTVPDTTTATTVANTSDYTVGVREMTYVDASRPTAKNGDYAGAPTRTIRTVFYYPESNGKPA